MNRLPYELGARDRPPLGHFIQQLQVGLRHIHQDSHRASEISMKHINF